MEADKVNLIYLYLLNLGTLKKQSSANTSNLPLELWRVPLGESGLLGFFLDLIKGDDTPQDLAIQCFRIIGNSCADNGSSLCPSIHIQEVFCFYPHAYWT